MLTKSEIKSLKTLQQKKHRDEQKSFLVEGKRSVAEAVKFNQGIELILLSHDMAEKDVDFISEIENHSIRYEVISAKEIDSISDVRNSQGVIAKLGFLETISFEKSLLPDKKARIIILDSVSDPGNMGTIIRSADWFGMDGIIVCGDSVDIYNPKVVRSTMGSIFHLPVILTSETIPVIEDLKKNGYLIFAADLNGEPYNKIKYPLKTAVVFGNEAHGISAVFSDLTDKKITIPKIGNAESLNVAISAGIIMSHLAC